MQWTQPLQDYQILGVVSDEGRGLFRGCYWASETRHGVIDIDQGSKYHNPKELQELTENLALVGLKLVPYQSSNSGGWHLYYFLEDWTHSKEVEKTLKAYLLANKYEIKSGSLEIFPSGNALRLPLQSGFGWLDTNGKLITTREELNEGQAIALFVADLEFNQTNWTEAKERIESQLSLIRSAAGDGVQEHKERVAVEGSEELFTRGIDWEKYQRGREYWLYGLTRPGQRHDAVICVGHYLWFGDASQGVRALPFPRNAGARAELITAWLREKHNGHSEAVNSGQWSEVEGQIQRACYWTAQGALVRESVKERERYPLTERLIDRLCETKLTPEDFKKANRRKEGAARAKIRAALTDMLAQGRHPTIRGLEKETGCDRDTVRRHSDIWAVYAVHPSTLRMSKGGDAYITGGRGAVPGGSMVLASSDGLGSEPSGSVFKEEELTDPPSVLGSSDLAVADPLDSPVAPLLFCLAESLPPNSQHQDQALRVAPGSQVLTLGPWFGGIQAERQVCAGGISLFSGAGLVGPGSGFWQAGAAGPDVVAMSGAFSSSQGVTPQFFNQFVGVGSAFKPGGLCIQGGGIAGRPASSRCRGP